MTVVVSRPHMIPDIVSWSAESFVSPRVIPRGFGIGYVEELPRDRDAHGVLWERQALGQGKGRPQFGRVHSGRQRRAMSRLLCQVCRHPADRDEHGVLWVIEDHRSDWRDWPEGLVTAHPPLCLTHARESVTACPHLRSGAIAVRARASEVWGVLGSLCAPGRPDGPMPARGARVEVAYADDSVRWVLANQLLRTLHECTVFQLGRSP